MKTKEVQPQENECLSYLYSSKIQLQEQEVIVKKKSSWQRKHKTTILRGRNLKWDLIHPEDI